MGLIAAAKNRDETAIRTIHRTQNRMLFRIARSILPSDDEAEDAVQAAYVSAFSRLGGFRGEARLGTWGPHRLERGARARAEKASDGDDGCAGIGPGGGGDPLPAILIIV